MIEARYEKPLITAMDEDEVLAAFQMTAAQISAAGCWWVGGGCAATGKCTGSGSFANEPDRFERPELTTPDKLI